MYKWGLVGCGDIAHKRVAPAILGQQSSVLAAVVSPYPDELRDFQDKTGVTKGFSNVDDMLACNDIDAGSDSGTDCGTDCGTDSGADCDTDCGAGGGSGIDIVYVATPVNLHYEIALKALKAGKHVLVEKPMAKNDDECRILVETAERNGLKLGVAYFRRFFPTYAEVKNILAQGVIGDVIRADIMFNSWYDPKPEDPKYWRVIKDKGYGGPLWDMGCHKLDLLVYLFGMPKSVSAFMSTKTHNYEVEDSCSALMEFDDSMCCSAAFHWNSRVWHDRFEILGTEGKLILCPADGDTLQIERTPRVVAGMGKEVTSIIRPLAANTHTPLIDDFINAIEQDRTPVVSGQEGRKTNRILTAIGNASINNKVVIL